jgi:hypothetical protein
MEKHQLQKSAAKTNKKKEPCSCLGRVFYIELFNFAVLKEGTIAKVRPCLKLKTQPRYNPSSLTLSI